MSDVLTNTTQSIEHRARDWENNLPGSGSQGQTTNVGQMERIISLVAGGVLVAYGLRHRGLGGLALTAIGGGLAYRGSTGHCEVYDALSINTAQTSDGYGAGEAYIRQGLKIEESVTINKSPEELYRFWRNFENLPRFMKHLEEVTHYDDMRSHWVTKAPAGMHVAWDAEIMNEIDGELIAWRSLEGADIKNTGSVHFETAPGGRGTVVTVVLQYDPPGGKLGATIAKLFGEEPSIQIKDDLRRFKQLMETGEIATTEGQPRGKK